MSSISEKIIPRYRRLSRRRWDQLNDRRELLEAVRDVLSEQGQNDAACILISLSSQVWQKQMTLLLGPEQAEGGQR